MPQFPWIWTSLLCNISISSDFGKSGPCSIYSEPDDCTKLFLFFALFVVKVHWQETDCNVLCSWSDPDIFCLTLTIFFVSSRWIHIFSLFLDPAPMKGLASSTTLPTTMLHFRLSAPWPRLPGSVVINSWSIHSAPFYLYSTFLFVPWAQNQKLFCWYDIYTWRCENRQRMKRSGKGARRRRLRWKPCLWRNVWPSNVIRSSKQDKIDTFYL